MNALTHIDALSRADRQAQVVAALSAVLPQHALLYTLEDTVPFECDGLTAYRERPLVVALPETEAQVQAVLKACHALGVPVVARGAGTGLSGGAMPHKMGVTLSMAKFNQIVKVDAVSRTAVVQCGVRNLAISEAAAPHGLYYAPDPSSQIACTIGGNVAENSGGVHCLKYGLTLHNVLKVRGFTIEGEPITFGSDALDTTGFDLLSVLVGSEGMLAITTEVTVKLVPKPQLARCIMASFDDIRKAGDAVAAVIAAGIIPAGLEMMDKPMTAAVEDFVHAGYDLNAEAILLCESDGTPEEVEEEIDDEEDDDADGAKAAAISAEALAKLREEVLTRFAAIRKTNQKMNDIRLKKGIDDPAYKKLHESVLKELMEFRFSAKQVEALCDSVRNRVNQIRTHERKLMDFCVEKSGMPRTHFIKSFPGNETNLDWLVAELKQDKPYNPKLERFKHSIVDQQDQLIAIEKEAGLSIKDLKEIWRGYEDGILKVLFK